MCQYINLSKAARAALNSSTASKCSAMFSDVMVLNVHKSSHQYAAAAAAEEPSLHLLTTFAVVLDVNAVR